MKIAVIGSGISGITAAKMLSDKHEVVVFEKQSRPGGLIKCDSLPEGLFHKVGGHVFNSKNQQVLDWFWSHFDKETEFQQVKRNAKILFNDSVIGYPIENYIYLLDRDNVIRIMEELIVLQKSQRQDPFTYQNFAAFLRGNFGDSLYELYFQPYNKKLWQVDLETVSMQWLEGKLPMPDYREIIISNILREEEHGMVHSKFFYPIKGGSQFLVDRLSKSLRINTSEAVSNIAYDGTGLIIQDQSDFDRIVFTGDVREMPAYFDDLIQSAGISLTQLKALRSNGTSNLFCETDDTDISWLYIPQPFTRAHRIIYTGNFADSNNKPGGRKTCVVEFSGEVAPEVMHEEIKKLPGNLRPVAHNYEPNSYIIHDQGTRTLMSAVKAVLAKQGIYLLGRFAEWEYYNMDKCIESAFTICQEIEHNTTTEVH